MVQHHHPEICFVLLIMTQMENLSDVIGLPLVPLGFQDTRRSTTPGWGTWEVAQRRQRNPRSRGEWKCQRRRGQSLLHPGDSNKEKHQAASNNDERKKIDIQNRRWTQKKERIRHKQSSMKITRQWLRSNTLYWKNNWHLSWKQSTKKKRKKKRDYVQDFFFQCAQPVSLMWMWGSSLIKKLSPLFNNIFFKNDIGSGFSVCWSFRNVAQARWRSENHPSKQWESRSSPVKKKRRWGFYLLAELRTRLN